MINDPSRCIKAKEIECGGPFFNCHFFSYFCLFHCALQSIQHFLDNPHILEYVAQLGSQKLQSGDNWFTRVETTMLADMLKLLKIVLPATVSAHTENILSILAILMDTS